MARGAGFAEIRARWLAAAAGLGGPIRVAGRARVARRTSSKASTRTAVCCCARPARSRRSKPPTSILVAGVRTTRRRAPKLSMKASTDER